MLRYNSLVVDRKQVIFKFFGLQQEATPSNPSPATTSELGQKLLFEVYSGGAFLQYLFLQIMLFVRSGGETKHE